MKPLVIDRGDFLLALNSHDIEHSLDLQTGLVVPFFEHMTEDDDPDIEEDPDRYRFIEPVPSRDGFRWMEDFADQQVDPHVREDLLEALERRRPFRSFKDALTQYPEVREHWFVHEKERLLEYARSWLSDEGIEADLAEIPAPTPA